LIYVGFRDIYRANALDSRIRADVITIFWRQPVSASDAGSMASQRIYDPDKTKWTVMVFMGADSLPGDADLSKEAADDIKEMQAVGSTESLNIFVQVHNKGSVERRHIGKGDPQDVTQSARGATNGRALIDFLAWALNEADHVKEDRSMLVLWGHAYRFGIGPQTTPHGVDALDFAELANVLRDFQARIKLQHPKHYGLDEMPKLDIVAFDACDLASIEMAYQLYPYADYLLASQIGIPLPGWPYDRVLDRLKNPKGRVMGPAELGCYIARRYCSRYAADDRMVALSMLDLRRASQLFDLTETLARRLAIAVDANADELSRVSDLFVRARMPDDRPFVDVAELCMYLMQYSNDAHVRSAAKALGDLLISPNPEEDGPGQSAIGVGRPFVVENSRNSAETAALNGVSLYAPHVSDSHDFKGASHFYEKFVFAKQTLWNGLVHALALPN
jgi:hypothetical protein